MVEEQALKRTDRVLIVDGLRETADVLRAVLAPRGLDVARIRGDGAESLPDADVPAPRVVVLHQDGHTSLACSPAAAWLNVPHVIIGSEDSPDRTPPFSGDSQQYLRKPFQYGDLVHAIERLLDTDAA